MLRKEMVELLKGNWLTIRQIAQLTGQKPRDVQQDMEHIVKSLKHGSDELEVIPARCRKCGFEFRSSQLSKPSKCPQCRGSWITEPRMRVVASD